MRKSPQAAALPSRARLIPICPRPRPNCPPISGSCTKKVDRPLRGRFQSLPLVAIEQGTARSTYLASLESCALQSGERKRLAGPVRRPRRTDEGSIAFSGSSLFANAPRDASVLRISRITSLAFRFICETLPDGNKNRFGSLGRHA